MASAGRGHWKVVDKFQFDEEGFTSVGGSSLPFIQSTKCPPGMWKLAKISASAASVSATPTIGSSTTTW
jgi:hypothetical protein